MGNETTTILLIEDNEKIQAANARLFRDAGYSVALAGSISRARDLLQEQTVNVIVLDIMLPDGNGLDFIEEIRRFTFAPILLLTALGEKDDRIRGLREGGDDYISKPYDINELLARVEAFLRRDRMYGYAPVKMMDLGPLRLDPVSGQALLNGRDLLLTQKEFALLYILARVEGQTMSAKELYRNVWNRPMLDNDHPVKNVIYRLRKKIAESGYEIGSVRGQGYSLYRER